MAIEYSHYQNSYLTYGRQRRKVRVVLDQVFLQSTLIVATVFLGTSGHYPQR